MHKWAHQIYVFKVNTCCSPNGNYSFEIWVLKSIAFSEIQQILLFYVFRNLWLYKTIVFSLKKELKLHSLEGLAHTYGKSLAITRKVNVPEMFWYWELRGDRTQPGGLSLLTCLREEDLPFIELLCSKQSHGILTINFKFYFNVNNNLMR